MENKKTLANNLQYYMAKNHKTRKDVADGIGVSYYTFCDWINAKKFPRIDKVELLAEYFGIQKSDLIEPRMNNAFPLESIKKIPILGRISAGLPLLAEEDITGYTYTELNGGSEYFGLKVKGDSMTGVRINEGDVLIVRIQPEVENGQIAVVMVGDDEATVKRFYQTGNIVTLMPQSLNPAHKPQIYNTEKTNVKVIGLVVQNQITF